MCLWVGNQTGTATNAIDQGPGGNLYKYDAWNRMVSINAGLSNAEYILYDADNRRPGLNVCACTGSVTNSYYSIGWQDLEDDNVQGSTTTKDTFVWSESYIDDVIARDRSVNGGAASRKNAQQDANHDVVSILNTSGSVQERFVYDPYGTATVLTSAWASSSDSQGWVYRFQGGRYDPVSGLVNFRNRDLNTVTGTWTENDPAGYVDGSNMYQFVNCDPTGLTDPSGLLFEDKGNTGNEALWWVLDPNQEAEVGGGHGNQPLGSVQVNHPPVIITGCSPGGRVYAYVKRGTGIVTVIRSYTGVKSGDQGIGVAGSSYAGKRVYVTTKLASALNAHEQGHVDAARLIYNHTIRLPELMARHFTHHSLWGEAKETEAEVGSRLSSLIDWDRGIQAFESKDIAVNGGDGRGTFHGFEAEHGGGPVAYTGAGIIDGVNYDEILKDRSENDPNYNDPPYGSFDPYAY